MLRIVTQLAEVRAELRRIGERFPEAEMQARREAVREIVEAVRYGGDRSLSQGTSLEPGGLASLPLRVSGSELDAAYQQLSKELLDAIQETCRHLEAFHRKRLPKSWVDFGEEGVVWGRRYVPLRRAGLYLPGGHGACLSRLLLQAIPAKVARVSEIVMATPPGPEGKIHPGILVAAQEAGIGEIYRLGGAAAIAALAYGTETVPPVEAIVGSGGLEVALAKQLVWGTVRLEGAREVLDLIVIADREAEPVQVAADLLAQAEQDPLAAAILLTTEAKLAAAVQEEVRRQLQHHPQRLLAEKAIAHYGLIGLVDSWEVALGLSDAFAPQVLALQVEDPWSLVERLRHASTILLGSSTPRSVGDYLGVLSPHLSAAIGVELFLKTSNLLEYSPLARKTLSRSLQTLAEAQGWPASALSVRLRTQPKERRQGERE